MTPAPTLQDLIREVQHDAPDPEPLKLLETAAAMIRSLDDVGDAALGYFVDQARRAGHSWSEIGESLGVSKQAAQQRQVARTGGLTTVTFERFTDRARRVVASSQDCAREFHHNYIGTEHLLLAQFSMPEGLAAQVLTESGLSADIVRQAIRDRVGEGTDVPDGLGASSRGAPSVHATSRRSVHRGPRHRPGARPQLHRHRAPAPGHRSNGRSRE